MLAGKKKFCAKIFPKLLLGQCTSTYILTKAEGPELTKFLLEARVTRSWLHTYVPEA